MIECTVPRALINVVKSSLHINQIRAKISLALVPSAGKTEVWIQEYPQCPDPLLQNDCDRILHHYRNQNKANVFWTESLCPTGIQSQFILY